MNTSPPNYGGRDTPTMGFVGRCKKQKERRREVAKMQLYIGEREGQGKLRVGRSNNRILT